MSEPNLEQEFNNHHTIIKPLFQKNFIDELIRPKQLQNDQWNQNQQSSVPKRTQIHENRQQINHNYEDLFQFNHLNFTNTHKVPHFFNMCLNPELQSHQNRSKIRHIDEMNKSVKQIMRCNKQYRGQLLSAYQNKTKIQLENAILAKERQNLEDQKDILLTELEENKKKVSILENSIQRLKENHKKINDKLKDDIQQLHKQLNILRNTRYDLENKSNENSLYLKKIQNNQTRIKSLEQQLQKASSENLQLNFDLSKLTEKYNTCNSEKNHLVLLHVDHKKISQNLEATIKQLKLENENLNNKHKALTWQYDNIRRQYQYQRNRAQNLVDKLDRAQMSNQDRYKQFQSCQQEYNQLIQVYVNTKSQLERLKALPYELQTARKTNEAFFSQISEKQYQNQQLNYVNSQQLQQIQQIRSQNARLMYEFEAYKEATTIGAKDCVQGYQGQMHSLRFSYQSQVKGLANTICKLQQEYDRLLIALAKKQEIIKAKESQINHHLGQILSLQSRISQMTKDSQQKKSVYLSQMTELQAKISNNQDLISSLELAVKQLKAQNFQILKKQIIKIAEKDNLISILQLDFKNMCNQHDKNIQKASFQQRQHSRLAQQKQNSLLKELQSAKQQIKALQNDNIAKSRFIDTVTRQLQAKKISINSLTNENQNLKSLNENLKGQIAIIEAEYDIIENQLKQEAKEKHQIAQKLQYQQRKFEKIMKLNQRYTNEIQQLKIRGNLIQSKRINAKREYEQQISHLTESLSIIRADHIKVKTVTDSLQAMYKQIHLIQQIQRILMIDPKISISRFSHHVTALHRQAFTREVEKINKYLANVINMNEEVKVIIDCLKLNINAVNKSFEVTFSQRRPNSTSILYQK